MGYYYFEKCGEELIPQLDELAIEFDMDVRNTFEWNGHIRWERGTNHDEGPGIMHMTYQPTNERAQLGVQTYPGTTHLENEETRKIVRRLIGITGADKVYDTHMEEWDLDEFEE